MTYPKAQTGLDQPAGDVPSTPRFPDIEERVLAYWKDDGTFRASVDARDPGDDGSNEFVFYDGPPFANGLPHYGHLLTGYVKDLVPRYQTMRGRRVERRFGWDTHGLPAELEAMRLNGIKTTDEIVAMGIDRFNEACRASVLKYTGEWEAYVTRQARWVDFEHDYRTLNPEYMESVIWAFKQLHEKGLVYEDFRVLPKKEEAPSNLAVMVGTGIDYVAVDHGGTSLVMAEARLGAYARELGDEPAVVWRGTGADLVGLVYAPPFSYYADHENAFRVVAADEAVTTTDGTGLVHSAGAFGEVDKEVTDREGIAPVMPVAKDGRFTEPVSHYAGMQVFDANPHVIDDLKNGTGAVTSGTLLLRRETYDHSYPHCWRCRQPLIYKGVESWFVRVTAFKDRMVELNQQIRWVPDHIRDGQFGKWLENARDWSITRNRVWGSPVPVWKSDDPAYPRIDVYGSFEEIERDFGTLPLKDGVPDLHRPYVDDLVRPNPDDPTGTSMMRRVPDVLDVWFDSGSMSFAQNHYPFENGEWFEGHFPADFIVEYIGQTRGWFYTLHVLATALFDRPAFETCVSHGIVLGSDGNKMSKSLRNYPDVSEVFDRDGADAMRWFLMASPILRGGNLVVTEQGIRDSVRQVMIPLWNSWAFLGLYANAAEYDARPLEAAPADPLDRYVVAKLGRWVREMTTYLDDYAIAEACESTRDFLDVLTNWYIRRSRERFWLSDAEGELTDEQRAPFDTLYTVLETVCRVVAPLLPLVSEEIWRGLTGLEVAVPDPAALSGFEEVVARELNVREVRFVAADSEEAAAHGLTSRLTVHARVAGPRLGKDVQQAIKGSKSGDWSVADDGTVTSGGIALQEGEFTLEQVAGASGGTEIAVLPRGGFVALDTTVTPELEAEGLARDVVRGVQQARRDAGLSVSDRIVLHVDGDAAVLDAVRIHEALVAGETLATSVHLGDLPEGTSIDVTGASARVAVARA